MVPGTSFSRFHELIRLFAAHTLPVIAMNCLELVFVAVRQVVDCGGAGAIAEQVTALLILRNRPLAPVLRHIGQRHVKTVTALIVRRGSPWH